MPSSAAKRENETSEETEKTSVPPAGGSAEARIGREVLDFLHANGYVVDANRKPRTWTEKFLDEAIPAAVTVGAIVVGYAGVTLVRTRLGDRRQPKALIEVVTPPQMEASTAGSGSRRAS